MRLTVITSSTWIIAAVVDDRGRCSVREALDAVAVTELKTPRWFRLVYFFERRRLVVCSELCKKPKPRELRGMIIRRARGLRAAYLVALAAGDMLVEIGA